jgi:hypothetical protein
MSAKKHYFALSYEGLPSAESLGGKELYLVNDNLLFKFNNNGHFPDGTNEYRVESNFRRVGRIACGVEEDHGYGKFQHPNGAKIGRQTSISFDLEHLWVDGADLAVPQEKRKEILTNLAKMIKACKNEYSSYVTKVEDEIDFGNFMYPPAAISKPLQNTSRLAEEQNFSEDLNDSGLLKQLTCFFPEFYRRDEDFKTYCNNVMQQIYLLRAYDPNKPIYGYVWPMNASTNPSTRWKAIDKKEWHDGLKFINDNADGLVFWGGFDPNPKTNPNGDKKLKFSDWSDYFKIPS